MATNFRPLTGNTLSDPLAHITGHAMPDKSSLHQMTRRFNARVSKLMYGVENSATQGDRNHWTNPLRSYIAQKMNLAITKRDFLNAERSTHV